MRIAHQRLQPVRMHCPLSEHLACALPDPEQRQRGQQHRECQHRREEAMIAGPDAQPVVHAEAAMRPSDQQNRDLPPSPERDESEIDSEHCIVATPHIKSGVYVTPGCEMVEQ